MLLKKIQVKTCFFCGNIPRQTYYVFDKEQYRKSEFVQQIEFNEAAIDVGSIICSTCHNSLLSQCIVDCNVCVDRIQRKEAYVYDEKKYRRWSQNKQGQVKNKNTCKIKRYICINVTHGFNQSFNVFHAIYNLVCTWVNITIWMNMISNNILFPDVCLM